MGHHMFVTKGHNLIYFCSECGLIMEHKVRGPKEKCKGKTIKGKTTLRRVNEGNEPDYSRDVKVSKPLKVYRWDGADGVTGYGLQPLQFGRLLAQGQMAQTQPSLPPCSPPGPSGWEEEQSLVEQAEFFRLGDSLWE